MEIRIRSGPSADVGQLAELLLEVNDLHAALLPGVFRPTAADAATVDFLRGWVAREGRCLLVADDEHGPVGCALVVAGEASSQPIFVPRRWAEVELLVVANRARGRGIGRTLMDAAADWAAAEGAARVQVVVWEANAAAVRFYERLGYATARG